MFCGDCVVVQDLGRLAWSESWKRYGK